jgi:hypothetical protein
MRKIHNSICAAATALLGVVATPVASASAADAAGQAHKVISASGYLSVDGALARPASPLTNGTSLCASNRTSEPFNFLIWSGGTQTSCIRAFITIRNPGTLSRFIVGAGGRAWMHQNADGSGWADCFSPGSAWNLLGRDTNPGNIQFVTNTEFCQATLNVGNTSLPTCGAPRVSLYGWATSSAGPQCWEYPSFTVTSGLNGLGYLINTTGNRIWLHQNADGSGWADCFSGGSPYYVGGTRDANPGNLEETSNSAYC